MMGGIFELEWKKRVCVWRAINTILSFSSIPSIFFCTRLFPSFSSHTAKIIMSDDEHHNHNFEQVCSPFPHAFQAQDRFSISSLSFRDTPDCRAQCTLRIV